MRTSSMQTPTPAGQSVDWHQDSDLAALTIHRDGEQRTWRNSWLGDEPLIDAWAATALLDGRQYRRLSMAELAALRRG